jgi:hypothetical protein
MTLERDPDYPALRHVGGLDVTLSYMSSTDADAILRFARGLEEHDLLFLRRDITQLEVVEDWLRDIESGDALTILAKRGGRVIGYGTLHRDSPPSRASASVPRRCSRTTSRTARGRSTTSS